MHNVVLDELGHLSEVNSRLGGQVVAPEIVVQHLQVLVGLLLNLGEDLEDILDCVGVGQPGNLGELVLDFLHFEQEDEILFFVLRPFVLEVFKNLLVEVLPDRLPYRLHFLALEFL